MCWSFINLIALLVVLNLHLFEGLKMGGQQSKKPITLGFSTTAKQVVEHFGEGKYLAGKTAIVTGGNSGIGLETCKALAFAGARVILCSRSVSAGEKAMQYEFTHNGYGGYKADTTNTVVKELDLNSLASVKKFATDFLATEARLDFLVLNAGIMALPRKQYTEDGFEKQIGVNHFGHFYLTQLLQDKLLTTPDSAGRVVVVSSTAHSFGSVNTQDLHYTKGRRYGGWEAYGQSKQANILFAKALADRLKTIGSSSSGGKVTATAVSLHPGVIRTNLWRASVMNRIFSCLVSSKTIPQGAATTVFACVAPEVGLESFRGAYLDNCHFSSPCGSAQDHNGVLRQALWATTEEQIAAAVAKAGI